MPKATSSSLAHEQLRVLAYGEPKTRKTLWALKAAEAGFNVFDFDFERGHQIIQAVKPEAKERIGIIDLAVTNNREPGLEFFTRFIKGEKFVWDEATKRVVPVGAEWNPEHSHIAINSREMSYNDVIIFDSWTESVDQLVARFARENSIDLSEAAKQEWEGYRWCGALASWFLQNLKTLPCHVIVTGHSYKYEKKKGQGKQQVTEWSKIMPKSVSGNHSLSLAGQFTDIIFFELIGTSTMLDVRPDPDRQAGSRFIEPNRYGFNDLQFSTLADKQGFTPSGEPSKGIRFFDPGECPEEFQRKKAPLTAATLAKPNTGEPQSPSVSAASKPNLQLFMKAKGGQ